ncbi:MAG: alpha-amylase family glycosyl hydrolase [Thermodesulfovibrionales bacterium]
MKRHKPTQDARSSRATAVRRGKERKRMRRLPVGAEVLSGGGVHFRVWAPRRKTAEVVIESGPGYRQTDAAPAFELNREASGYFSGVVPAAVDGTFYRYRLDAGGDLFPDPASRFQPEGPHGPSQVVDPDKFRWTDGHWLGAAVTGQIIYEMHIGTFTPEGTWKAACALLPQLAETGVTLLEVMPVADFSGRFGWGYDGVDLFAPTRLYGTPEDFREFVNRAHTIGMGVILDVVYNHVGPDGCYVSEFSDDYFTDRYKTDWGPALNFDGENSGPVREFVLSNVI